MDIINQLFNQFVVGPLYNLLVLLTATMAQNQLWLSCLIVGALSAIIFLPTMIMGFFDQEHTKDLEPKISALAQGISDPSKREKHILELLKKRQIRFQSESIYLFGQAIILGLLYPILTFHLRHLDRSLLYPFTLLPSAWNTTFGPFDLAASSPVFSFLPALLLFFELRQSYRQQSFLTSFTDRWYPVILPLCIYLLVFWLPTALSLILSVSLMVSLYLRFMLNMVTTWRKRARQ